MRDLKHVHAVKAGVDAFVALVIRAAVQHLIIYDQVIVSEEYLSDQCESRVSALRRKCAAVS